MRKNNLKLLSIITLVCFLVQNASPVLAGSTPKELKQNAITTLESVSTVSASLQEKILKAIEEISKSLFDKGQSLFINETQLIPPPEGTQVFKHERKAVKRLEQAIKDDNPPQETQDTFNAVISDMVEADRQLAELSINNAQALVDLGIGDAKDLAKARKKFDQALLETKPHEAINDFEKAWKSSQEVVKGKTLGITQFSDTPDPFSPTVTSNTLTTTFRLRHGGDDDDDDEDDEEENQFFLELVEVLKDPSGNIVRTLTQEREIIFADETKEGKFFITTLETSWDGKDNGGLTVPDGTYSYLAYGKFTEVETDDDETEIHEIFSSPVSGDILLDNTSPVITDLNPSDGTALDNPRPALSGSYTDALTGIDVSSVNLTLDNIDITSQAIITSNSFNFTPPEDLSDGDHTLQVQVSDLVQNQAGAQTTFTLLTNQPPTLGPIGDKTASLGSILNFNINAQDPDGDSLVLNVTPVPLPKNVKFDLGTGGFSFKPSLNQVGSFDLTFSVTDGEFSAEETITITVPAPTPGQATSMSGRILDTNDFVQGIETPVVNATTSLLGTGVSAKSDADGYFVLNNVPSGNRIFDIDVSTANDAPDGSPYAGFREGLHLIHGVPNIIERPFFLPRIARESLTTVDPNNTTIVTNPTLGITMTVIPHNAKNPDGTDFTGELSISRVPEALAPAALPEDLQPGLLITIQPVGVSYEMPVPITFPNIDNLASDSELNLWSLDPDVGEFTIVGRGRVSSDGSVIETISGGIKANDWHMTLPPSGNPDTSVPENNQVNQPRRTGCPAACPGTTTNTLDGETRIDPELPTIRSLGVSQGLEFIYSSTTADMRPILSFDSTILSIAAVPPLMSYELSVANLDQGNKIFVDTSVLFEFGDQTLRNAIQFDASDFSTGFYPYSLRLTSEYPFSAVSSTLENKVLVHNQSTSSFGSGWGLDGIQRLYPQPDGSAVFTDGDGSAIVFGPPAPPQTLMSTNPNTLLANGITQSTIDVSGLGLGLSLAPDGTPFALSVDLLDSSGNLLSQDPAVAGRLTGGDPLPANDRFRSIQSVNGTLQGAYTSPTTQAAQLDPGPTGRARINVHRIQENGQPAEILASTDISLIGDGAAAIGSITATPAFIDADGVSTSDISLSDITNSLGFTVSDGTEIAIKLDLISAGTDGLETGSLSGGTPDPTDPSIQRYQAQGGTVSATYTAPDFSSLAVANPTLRFEVHAVSVAGQLGAIIGTLDIILFGPDALRLTSIQSTAAQGTPNDPALPSANVGQSMVLVGRNLTPTTLFTLPGAFPDGRQFVLLRPADSLNPEGTQMNASLTFGISNRIPITGFVQFFENSGPNKGAVSETRFLQVVPTLSAFLTLNFNGGTVAKITGSGFHTNQSRVRFTSPTLTTEVSIDSPTPSTSGREYLVTIPPGFENESSVDVNVITDGGISNTLAVALPQLIAIQSTAAQGTPQNPAEASTNIGQTMTIIGRNLTSTTILGVTGNTSDGSRTREVGHPLFNISPDGTQAEVSAIVRFVPGAGTLIPTTSFVRLAETSGPFSGSTSGSKLLQVVPTLTSFSSVDLNEGTVATLGGTGFHANRTTVRFISPTLTTEVPIIAVTNTSGTQLTVNIPPGFENEPDFSLEVVTDGGASNNFSEMPRLLAINTTAAQGTPQNPAEASTNIGQTMTIIGRNLTSTTILNVPAANNSDGSTTSPIRATLTNVSLDGTQAEILLTTEVGRTNKIPLTGFVQLSDNGSTSESRFLQIVSTISVFSASDFSSGTVASFSGSGFHVNQTSVRFISSTLTTEVPIDFVRPGFVGTRAVVTFPPGFDNEPDLSLEVVTDGGVSNNFSGMPRLFAINTTAAQGTPKDPTLASANRDQTITIIGRNLTATTVLRTPSATALGVESTIDVPLNNVSPDGTQAELVLRLPGGSRGNQIPLTSFVQLIETSGPTKGSTSESRFLQVVPILSSFSSPDFKAGTTATLIGSAFHANQTSVRFISPTLTTEVPIDSVPNVFGTGITVTIPAGFDNQPDLSFEVVTDGGTSNTLSDIPRLFAIQSTAAQGMPQNPAEASTNIGQTMTIIGRNMTPTTVLKPSAAFATGAENTLNVPLNNVSPDGTQAEVTFPIIIGAVLPITGPAQLVETSGPTANSTSEPHFLQIVPVIVSFSSSDFNAGTVATIDGTGFRGNQTSVRFISPTLTTEVPIDSIVNVFATQITVTIPAGFENESSIILEVLTDGGTSNSFDANAPIVWNNLWDSTKDTLLAWAKDLFSIKTAYAAEPALDFVSPPGEFSVLTSNPDGTFTRTLKDGTRTKFSAAGLQTQAVDRNGNTTLYRYDADDLLIEVEDPAGLITSLSYTNGKIDSVTDPVGRITTLNIDPQGNLTQIHYPDGSQESFTYDSHHLVTSHINKNGNLTTFEYDFAGRLARTVTPNGASRQMTNAQEVGLVDTSDGLGTAANPAPIRRPDEAKGTLTDPNNQTITLRLDSLGSPIEFTDALNRLTTTIRDANGLPTQITQPNGAVTTMTYDTRGNLLTSTQEAINATTNFTYEPVFNQVTSITDPEGNLTQVEYDTQGNPTRITDANSHITEMSYDLRGLLTSITQAKGLPEENTTSFTYDPLTGNLLTTTDSLNNTTTLTYDDAGNVSTSTDPQGNTSSFQYDAFNRLTQVTDQDLQVTNYTYDDEGNLLTVTDANNNSTTFQYDEVNRLVTTTNSLNQSKTFTYDPNDNLLSTLDAKNQTITFEYDAVDQLIKKTLPDDLVTFEYDSVGNLTLTEDNDSKVTFQYDTLSRLTKTQTGDSTNPLIKQPETALTYTYDKNGNRKTLTDSEGTTTYTYDSLNRLTQLNDTLTGLTTFTYDSLSRRTSLTHANGVITTYAYDQASQLLELIHTLNSTPFLSFTYTYDARSNRDSKTLLSGIASLYTYDDLNRLTQATNPQEDFAYDPVGNRNPLSQVYDNANRLLDDTTFTYTYDNNGNRISKTDKTTLETTTYTYNSENQLIKIDKPDTSFVEYSYDALGRRIHKNLNNTDSITYIYDNEDILQEYDTTDTLISRFTHGPGIDEPLALQRAGQSFYYHSDALGSITEITDSSGSIVKSFQYDTFGNITNETGALTQPYAYTGRERDVESGLYHIRARPYDPFTGTFIQEDLVSVPGVSHLYGYVGNNPINYIDPTGLERFFVGSGISVIADLNNGDPNGKTGSVGVALGGPNKPSLLFSGGRGGGFNVSFSPLVLGIFKDDRLLGTAVQLDFPLAITTVSLFFKNEDGEDRFSGFTVGLFGPPAFGFSASVVKTGDIVEIVVGKIRDLCSLK